MFNVSVVGPRYAFVCRQVLGSDACIAVSNYVRQRRRRILLRKSIQSAAKVVSESSFFIGFVVVQCVPRYDVINKAALIYYYFSFFRKV